MALLLLDHLRSDSARFAAVLTEADPSAPVPTCPGWTAADLFWHLTEVQHFWGTMAGDRLPDPSTYEQPSRPSDDGLPDAFRAASDRLCDVLATTEDDVPCWTWLDTNQTVGFVRRRQAHEALIHRLDAELTVGARTALDAELATDGVLEALDWIFGGAPPWADSTLDGPVGRLTTDDTGAGWTIQLGRFSGTNPATGTASADEPMFALVDGREPSFEIAGAAADLDAWVWNRPTTGEIRRSGDTSTFETIIGLGVE